ncbi:hypothetical protein Tco_1490585 [Tanacetum coccineum]
MALLAQQVLQSNASSDQQSTSNLIQHPKSSNYSRWSGCCSECSRATESESDVFCLGKWYHRQEMGVEQINRAGKCPSRFKGTRSSVINVIEYGQICKGTRYSAKASIENLIISKEQDASC